jgi:hypothetical protein
MSQCTVDVLTIHHMLLHLNENSGSNFWRTCRRGAHLDVLNARSGLTGLTCIFTKINDIERPNRRRTHLSKVKVLLTQVFSLLLV